MILPKTQFVSLKESATRYSSKRKNKKFKYEFVHKLKHKLRDKLVTALAKVNFDSWKKPFLLQVIDIIYNGSIIACVIWFWRTNNPLLLGISITLFLILFKSYVEEYLTLFRKR